LLFRDVILLSLVVLEGVLGGGSGGGDIDDSISPPSNISVTTAQCGTLDGEDVIKDSIFLVWR